MVVVVRLVVLVHHVRSLVVLMPRSLFCRVALPRLVVVPTLWVRLVVVSVCVVILRVMMHVGVFVLRISVTPVAVLHYMLLVHCRENVLLIS